MQLITKDFIMENQDKTYAFFDFDGRTQNTMIIMSGKLKNILITAQKLVLRFTNQTYMDEFFATYRKNIKLDNRKKYPRHVSLNSSYYLVPIEESEIKKIIISQEKSLNYLKDHIDESILLGATNS